MKVRYLVSSPYGDIAMDNKRWQTPLPHDPNLTYGYYLEAVKEFISRDNYRPLIDILKVDLKDIDEILIRTEKHGALYYLASVEVILRGLSKKFAVNVATSKIGKEFLDHEFSVLRQLNNEFDLGYLPTVYLLGEARSMSMFLSEWFEGYYEFHISRDKHGKQKMVLWDFDHGYRYLSDKQIQEIYRQASKILTIYYDTQRFKQIFPWHHAAGDFVAKIDDKTIDVKLITARKYEPMIGFLENSAVNPFVALIYFFLNLSIRMRLDRFDGIGETAWADDFCVDSTVEGFFDGLKIKEKMGKYNLGKVNEFILLLKGFSKEELGSMLELLINEYKDVYKTPLIMQNLEDHTKRLFSAIQNLSL
ncbi:MAG: hypothetical protein LWW78_07925 [Deltaproteobacteria bacterium]|nr:hypothetical protein [Deltaproteobacteria bacterium]